MPFLLLFGLQRLTRELLRRRAWAPRGWEGLDVVVGKRAAIFKLLAREDQTLLIWRDPLLVLDLRFHVVDGVTCLHIQRDGLAGQRLHEDLHAATQAQHQVER